MPLIALASVKSSPGVTTTALALASMWKTAQRRLLLEADPGGGDLGLWLGLPADSGLAGLAAAARHGHEAGLAWRHARELAGGTHLVAAPAGAEQAAACVAALAAAKLPAGTGRRRDEPVLADCGRLYPGSPALAVAAAAALTVLVVRPRVSELAHLEPRVRGLEQAGLRLAVVLAADDRRAPAEPSYPAEEIAGVLGVPVQASCRPTRGRWSSCAAAPATPGRRGGCRCCARPPLPPGRWRRPWDARPPRRTFRPGRRTLTRRRRSSVTEVNGRAVRPRGEPGDDLVARLRGTVADRMAQQAGRDGTMTAAARSRLGRALIRRGAGGRGRGRRSPTGGRRWTRRRAAGRGPASTPTCGAWAASSPTWTTPTSSRSTPTGATRCSSSTPTAAGPRVPPVAASDAGADRPDPLDRRPRRDRGTPVRPVLPARVSVPLPGGGRLFAVMAVTGRPCVAIRRDRLVARRAARAGPQRHRRRAARRVPRRRWSGPARTC